ncbi:MAG: P-loop containing nucleoside triphosphate hydrolase protein [Benjaminiella poitrasii]|nr:MAG: P-loop containing nucleoside triphosphate hydrolase protein [Benjaminiella poitrasii]
MGPSCPIIIIGLASCQFRSLSQALQNSDIFGQHLLIPIPTTPQRKALLEHFLKDLNLEKIESVPNTVDYYATQISMKTPGYVARDLKLLVRQAKLKAMRSNDNLVEQFEQLSIGKDEKRKPVVRLSDFEYSLETYRPSQQIGMTLESLISKKKKAKSWDDLGGYEKIKDRIKQAVLLPMLQPDIFTKLGVKPPSGLLLYGPSGCGKTALAQALMSESMMNVISIRGPEIFSKYLGETEHKIRTLFSTAKRNSRSIVFIDEMDSIAMKRGFDMNDGNSSGGVNERVLSTLLNEIDGVEGRQDVILICCTNRPDQIDDALLRPGRLDQLIYIGLPTLEDRINIIKTLIKSIVVDDTIDPVELAKQTEFCTGADLESLFREAGTIALREDLNAKYISKHHIQQVLTPILEKAEDQILDGSLDLYERFLHEHHQ